ncbi:hypothetical protein CVT25_015192 [Psilocybe cyanescens]|uniref:Uncharacterized protein n=1 Tax=Psilocybe cyanescens TaxID=93625 RepID=A0A409WRK5_PSICY|nr:hypothetical protein CVT25_015192 [Psilocybe cyanescens]
MIREDVDSAISQFQHDEQEARIAQHLESTGTGELETGELDGNRKQQAFQPVQHNTNLRYSL